MTRPQSFETSWAEAERRAFAWLVASAGSTAGRDAFVGRDPGLVNAWHLRSLPVSATGENAFSAKDPRTLHIPYEAECVFQKREKCLDWAMRLSGGLPLCQDSESNVALLRINAIGAPRPDDIQLANEKAPVAVWYLTIGLDLVFETGGKANLAAARTD